jgi:hypothetical protein
MKNKLNRRDFLKIAGLLPLGYAAPRLLQTLPKPSAVPMNAKNIIVVVFDAFSAYDISYYGYERKTTPNIDRLSKRAIVYHNHFAGANFTTSGTASLLTGVLPWTHRALAPNSRVADPYGTQNLFGAFKNHYRIAYTHNGWAYTLLRQFSRQIEELIPREKLLLGSLDTPIQDFFRNDEDIASVSWARNMKVKEVPFSSV